jgi:hypothetical protein
LSPEEFVRLDDVKSKVMVPYHTFDVNSLYHISEASLRQDTRHIGIS